MLSHNGTSYGYGAKPHAVTSVGSGNHTYDNNGNMTTRPNGSIVWDAENRPISMTINGMTTNFTYDGDGNRVKQAVTGGNTTLYINRYFEKNLTANTTTSYYYLGGRLVAMKQGSANVTYIHQDHLTGTSVISDSSGALISSISYQPYGSTRGGSVSTDIKFTGQRLDDTGLYYYGARFYDPAIGRFISPDPIIQSPANPQNYNRYSYVLNNPLKYIDPSGLNVLIGDTDVSDLDDLMDNIQGYVDLGINIPQALLDQMNHLIDGLGEGGMDLWDAWEKLKNAAPELAGYLDRDDIPNTVIKWDKDWFVKHNKPGAAGAAPRGEGTIYLNPTNLHSKDPRETVVTLGHEGFHKAVELIYGAGGTLEEEAIAFGLGFKIGMALTPQYHSKGSEVGQNLFPGDYNRFHNEVDRIGGDLMNRQSYQHAPLAGFGSNLSLSNLYGLARWFWPGITW